MGKNREKEKGYVSHVIIPGILDYGAIIVEITFVVFFAET